MIFLFYSSISFENFTAVDCEDLKTGLICKIPNSPLFSNKCYKIKYNGEYEHVNVDYCNLYPTCDEVAYQCNKPRFSYLQAGYVERL